jgi:hypothetical protein
LYYPQFDFKTNKLDNEKELYDDTNVYNEWQGQMRYGKLVFDQLEAAILKDFYLAKQIDDYKVSSEPTVAVTWANAFPSVVDKIANRFGIYRIATERTRADVEESF